ncbi:type I pullulanase [Butyrivibrio sp. AE3004]|uniref:type I pullulanase n=1 Tax=Butyrivibrio sp. AE3004 TaxID=1506994 RepID=UPI000B10CDE1|nr:type I pullulanase [Butyrivibrio sp. AE3004]
MNDHLSETLFNTNQSKREGHTINMYYSGNEFEEMYTYNGSDLGFTYSKNQTSFRLWAPTAEEAYVNFYESGDYWKNDLKTSVKMSKAEYGTWTSVLNGDLAGTYYTFTVTNNGKKVEACDPYAKSTGVSGQRAMVLDLSNTNPDGWNNDTNPHKNDKITDAIIYELHIRDFSSDENSGMTFLGKYKAFTETGTRTSGGNSTGIDYLKHLGITHVHLLPFYDFGSVDENDPLSQQFNWGYDPVNFNVPEGSYSTNPHDGFVRVSETKEMIKALHDNGISVIMDVVYNHVHDGESFCMNKLVPGYFSRINSEGVYSNGSGCGNDTASERSMVRKYIVDSVCYWADEYHIDGFRFDLVGLLDINTINMIVSEVHKAHPDVIFYGEGWHLETVVTKENIILATQSAADITPDFAYFNDNMRDGLKGNIFSTDKGWVAGNKNLTASIHSSFTACETWCKNPSQIVQYVSCHDNNTLFDRIALSTPGISEDIRIKMCNLAASFYLASEGIAFMQAGEELLRTKIKEDGTYESNSFNSGDKINSIKWGVLDDQKYQSTLEYYKGLIAFRKMHGLLRLTNTNEVKNRVFLYKDTPKNTLAFLFDNEDKALENEPSEQIFIAFNPTARKCVVTLPTGTWNICVRENRAGTVVLDNVSEKVAISPYSSVFLVR